MIHAMTELKYMVNSSDFENAGNVSQDLKKKLTEMNIDPEKSGGQFLLSMRVK